MIKKTAIPSSPNYYHKTMVVRLPVLTTILTTFDCRDMPEVAMHWQHRFNHMVKRYNDIYRIQIPNITPHVCRHTYCTNMAKTGISPKTLQYLMGHADISVTLNVYTHVKFEDAEKEIEKMQDSLRLAREELDIDKGSVDMRLFRAV